MQQTAREQVEHSTMSVESIAKALSESMLAEIQTTATANHLGTSMPLDLIHGSNYSFALEKASARGAKTAVSALTDGWKESELLSLESYLSEPTIAMAAAAEIHAAFTQIPQTHPDQETNEDFSRRLKMSAYFLFVTALREKIAAPKETVGSGKTNGRIFSVLLGGKK